ncbi:sensor histidine kinase KdpD [bacterium]|nr:sensor histidine kinase KdpD [bacterium]
METNEKNRPDPDALLSFLKKEEEKEKRARLKIYFGMCAGAGKTYDMLKAAHDALSKNIDVVIGYIETHKRPDTEALLNGLPVISRKKIDYRGTQLEEMDLDAILARHPKLVLVDELAHTNAPGSRHAKRYQDVIELLDNGIDVYTTLNVQHLESRADTVAQITGATIRETVPDSIFEQADEIEVIDISPEELLQRLREGKVYTPERSQQAVQNFFREGNLTALREMALRLTAERVDHQLRDYMKNRRIAGPWKSSQRLLVGINASRHCFSLIRWARRLAYSINGSWVAVYVETTKQLSDADKSQLSKNVKLASELGAEVITTSDEDVAKALVRVAREQNATQILVGKSKYFLPFGKSLLEKIIEISGELDIHVVGGAMDAGNRLRWLRLPSLHSGWMQYWISAMIVIAVAAICFPVSPWLGYQTVSFILLLTVTLMPLKFGTGPVLLAAALSALIWNYFFIPPQFTFYIGLTHDALMFLTYFVIASVTGTLTARIRVRERIVLQREARTNALYALTRDLSNARNQNEVAKASVANIEQFFNGSVIIFLSDLSGDLLPEPHPASTFKADMKEFSVPSWVYWNEKKAGKFTDTLPFAAATYFPISGPRFPLGVIGIKLDRSFTIDQETLIENFIRQIASALEREQLNEINKNSIAVVESERLYKTLFNSISHELRTPIAAMITASESLQHTENLKHDSLAKDLLGEIHTAADRLNRLVGNLLDMARLESGHITIKSDWCDIHDIIHSVLQKLEHQLSLHTVTVVVSPDLPLLKIDFGLMEQVIMNLLLNAALYTPNGVTIEIKALKESHDCVLMIADNGPGFPVDALSHLFDKFYRVPGTKTGGTGLGLSIVRGFVEAHQGRISAENRKSGGAQFTIRLPLHPVPATETIVHEYE